MRFRQDLPSSHGINVGELKLHSQVVGIVVLLQVSELLPIQSDESMQEHAGWSGCKVVLRQDLRSSHGSNVGALLLHRHVGGVEVELQVSDVFPTQSVVSKHEHAG